MLRYCSFFFPLLLVAVGFTNRQGDRRGISGSHIIFCSASFQFLDYIWRGVVASEFGERGDHQKHMSLALPGQAKQYDLLVGTVWPWCALIEASRRAAQLWGNSPGYYALEAWGALVLSGNGSQLEKPEGLALKVLVSGFNQSILSFYHRCLEIQQCTCMAETDMKSSKVQPSFQERETRRSEFACQVHIGNCGFG